MHHPTSSKEHQLRTSKVRRAKDGRARTRGQKNQTAMMMTVDAPFRTPRENPSVAQGIEFPNRCTAASNTNSWYRCKAVRTAVVGGRAGPRRMDEHEK
jgi:hypothetical protein